MHWTPDYVLQSVLWVLLWLAAGAGFAAYTHRRGGR